MDDERQRDWPALSMQVRLPLLSADACDLICRLLVYNPNVRYAGRQTDRQTDL